MSWTNEDVRNEIYEQDEEEDEGPSWVDDKGKILEAAFCEYFLEKHPLMCLKQTLFDLDGEVDEDRLIYEIHQEIRYHARHDVAKKVKRLVEALKIEGKRLTKQRTCQTRSPSERIIPCNGRVILRAVSKIHGHSEKIH